MATALQGNVMNCINVNCKPHTLSYVQDCNLGNLRISYQWERHSTNTFIFILLFKFSPLPPSVEHVMCLQLECIWGEKINKHMAIQTLALGIYQEKLIFLLCFTCEYRKDDLQMNGKSWHDNFQYQHIGTISIISTILINSRVWWVRRSLKWSKPFVLRDPHPHDVNQSIFIPVCKLDM